MPAPILQFKRGVVADLPGLRAGEPGFATDSYDLYVGLTSATSTNKIVGSSIGALLSTMIVSEKTVSIMTSLLSGHASENRSNSSIPL